MKIIEWISQKLKHEESYIRRTVELLEDGSTVPFIARYRKEMTGNLDEEQIRTVQKELARLKILEDRRVSIIERVRELGKLTSELEKAIQMAETKTVLEDLYQPYKKKRKTRATQAREKGLQPLAELILNQPPTDSESLKWVKEFAPGFEGSEELIWQGARDIVAESISDHTLVRSRVREKALKWARMKTVKIKDASDDQGVFQTYYQFENQINRIRPHQVLAMNRGESEKVLRVKIEFSERDWKPVLHSYFRPVGNSRIRNELEIAIEDAADRLLLPAISRDLRKNLTVKAQEHAIKVFAENLESLLLQPPLKGRAVLAIDPAFRSGCKIAVIDSSGEVLDVDVIYPHVPQKKDIEAMNRMKALVDRHGVTLIAIGNGTASRETEQLVARFIKSSEVPDLQYVIVSEAGASVYSASPLAREEFPEMDVSLRGAVSIARRIQDPLAELVKIDPQSIGVGMYQHDLNQKELVETLGEVVESVVNRVGVHVNTASGSLLKFVSGIGPQLAQELVAHRQKHGNFLMRKDLKKVKGLGAKAFEQAAGFLRIRNGKNPMDASAIHPECYDLTEKLLTMACTKMNDHIEVRKENLKKHILLPGLEWSAQKLGMGIPTLKDILHQIVQPGRDPRDDVPAPLLRSDVLSMKDLEPGMVLSGTVRNAVDFGAFIDIGVKEDGLLHRSKIPNKIHLHPGNILDVTILEIDHKRKRISLGWVQEMT